MFYTLLYQISTDIRLWFLIISPFLLFDYRPTGWTKKFGTLLYAL